MKIEAQVLEAIIAALRQAVATYEILSMKNKPGKKGKARLADFQKILARIEGRMIEPADAILWVYDFCKQHGNMPRLVNCLLGELSRLLDVPLLLDDELHKEIQKIAASAGIVFQNETITAMNVIREQKAKLDNAIDECKEKLSTATFQDLMTVKLRTIH